VAELDAIRRLRERKQIAALFHAASMAMT
jgi:hypothetical protein